MTTSLRGTARQVKDGRFAVHGEEDKEAVLLERFKEIGFLAISLLGMKDVLGFQDNFVFI